ncbi:putative Endonuclease/exonuclease/phosphatase [Vibrio nigripulchritudo MADA3029]|uniref:endonuclease/exonuclease/phosphatase family protein n=1 Tax=Vibrio nigripulchritudo TaxID=28173 RepID=UPI0003B1EE1E|nr:endonuclease/exonuclease/phosphatase family protein [Vibrio nigripulchritudo]CCN45587.1 putative Endonuclease/exonuclease/phosphatase [Vibrio nigripulchritudo MADA3020]CCN55840.1 putative Endonuclease/exonuclease/phosphatase [Vibrio nigripulchritudo MADA3021]CCN57064.1 putative Endonuclease/exonuclease/phosphatase [Vibrio nigripulchritudo MADA3029]
MKKLTLVVTSLLAHSVSFANPDLNIDGPVETESIRIASYNIMASRMGDTGAIRDAIKSIDADIIGLQEVDNKTGRSATNFGQADSVPINQAEYFAKELGLHFAFCQAIEFDGGEYGHAVLSKYPVEIVKKVELPNKDDKEQRVACAIKVKVPNYPAPVIAVTAHLDHTDTDLRLDQVRTLNGEFSAWHFKNGLPVIIGDLNLPTQSNEYFELQQWFKETDKDLKLTAPAWNPDRKIDYIMTSAAQQWYIQNVAVPKPTDKVSGKAWYEISDHLPVIVDMKLTMK